MFFVMRVHFLSEVVSVGIDCSNWNIIDFKGEIRNRLNLFSEERVKNFEQNNENLMKIS